MGFGLFVRILLCIVVSGVLLYAYISKQNAITELRLQIPLEAKAHALICQENTRLQFEIDQFENPQHLMELSRLPEFSHLKYPLLQEIITIEAE